MEKIKFRAWDGQCMISWESMRQLGLNQFWFEDGKIILMQFTGLLDKNKKEIYGGDVVKILYPNGEIASQISEVKWGQYSDGEYVSQLECWMIGSLPLSEANTGKSYGHNAFEVEVIGNIHQNPELIKKESE